MWRISSYQRNLWIVMIPRLHQKKILKCKFGVGPMFLLRFNTWPTLCILNDHNVLHRWQVPQCVSKICINPKPAKLLRKIWRFAH